jgi:MEMO1 family protein
MRNPQLAKHFPWLSVEQEQQLELLLWERAARGYEQGKLWRNAAECWMQSGNVARASELYQRSGERRLAARVLLDQGQYAEALKLYESWGASLLAGDTLRRVEALLGQAACHLLGADAQIAGFNRVSGQAAYQQARELLRNAGSLRGRIWRLVAEYGERVGRYDLVELGYERALAGAQGEAERVEILRAWLEAVERQGDRTQAQRLQEQLAGLAALEGQQTKVIASKSAQKVTQTQPENLTDIRPSPIVGKWYESDPDKLANQILNALEEAPMVFPKEQVVGVMMPDAGYTYCLETSAKSMKQIVGADIDIVAIISKYTHPYSYPLCTSAHQAYQTPLGVVPVDQEMINGLKEKAGIQLIPRDPEHSIEIAIPILQVALSNKFRIVPIMMRDMSLDSANRLGDALGEILTEKKALLVVSSGLSLFYNAETAEKLDKVMLDAIVSMDPKKVIQTQAEEKGFANGYGAVAAGMVTAKHLGAKRAVALGHTHSGNLTGDMGSVAGYGAVVFVR